MWGLFDEYLWGDAFLVAPVLEKGQQEKSIFLPNGIWFDFFTGERLIGNGYVDRKIDLATFPVFVKAGSFVPMTHPMVNTSAYNPSEMEVHFWYDQSVTHSNYQLFEDDGTTRDSYQKGISELTTFTFDIQEGKIVFRIENKGGEYKGRPEVQRIKLVIHNLPEVFTAEGLKTESGISILGIELPHDQSKTIIISPH
jgi:oligosaccharide 4-alpha-D-glucosyltransferase